MHIYYKISLETESGLNTQYNDFAKMPTIETTATPKEIPARLLKTYAKIKSEIIF